MTPEDDLEVSPETSEKLRACLGEQADVLVAYVFGSRAEGRSREGSDLDVAVLLSTENAQERFERRLDLLSKLPDVCECEVDVVVLNDAPPLLQQEAIKNGRVIIEADRRARVDFEVEVGKINADLGPVRRFYRRALFEEIKKEGLGGDR
jgi:hypothetical protein